MLAKSSFVTENNFVVTMYGDIFIKFYHAHFVHISCVDCSLLLATVINVAR